ncbi:hypothetical protein F2Q69_00023812 [Brassica cretica]|uniref:Uncharacterized protein n=1 Tax=Brassica cretica TaxID=69181 RepID=A0A8S9PVU6_BRACR|nr:hypothetical protein F2Q69_00023812 [Brassica cretica]
MFCRRTLSHCWEVSVSACSSWLLVVCHRLGWSRSNSSAFPRMMGLGVVLNVERVPPFIVWGIVRRGSNTPSGFFTSFLPGLIGFSSDLWVLALLVSAPPLERLRCRRGFRIPWTGSAIVSTWLIEDFESFLRSDLFLVYTEDRSPEWSFTGKMRYLILLLGTPYLTGVFGVTRYLTTCGDDACGPSPSPSWAMKLL